MDYLFSQHDLSFLDDVIPEKDKKKKEDEKKKKKKKGSMDSDNDDVRTFLRSSNGSFLASSCWVMVRVLSSSGRGFSSLLEANPLGLLLLHQIGPIQNLFLRCLPFSRRNQPAVGGTRAAEKEITLSTSTRYLLRCHTLLECLLSPCLVVFPSSSFLSPIIVFYILGGEWFSRGAVLLLSVFWVSSLPLFLNCLF